ncbi:MAG TPA: cation transporter [Acidimicrobiales bacterium]|nr:cation transporter [Acidimicrobiales bacterium]
MAHTHAVRLGRSSRDIAVKRARLLNRVSIGWNVAEAFVALGAGVVAGSVSLVGFGFDSVIEVTASLILAWRLRQERRGACVAESDKRATKAIALSFFALAGYVIVDGLGDLIGHHPPDASAIGLAVAALSLFVMAWLSTAKRRLAPALGSNAVIADANQTRLCALLSGIVVIGVGANTLLGWWFMDPLAAIVVGMIAAREGVHSWRAESLEDTCCA